MGSYRPEQSFRESIKTLFVLHNETGNVWTHILGASGCKTCGSAAAAARSFQQHGMLKRLHRSAIALLSLLLMSCHLHYNCSSDTSLAAAAAPAGFFLFVGLAFFFCTHPPTPLAVTAEHIEVLLHDLQQQLQQQLHSLHVGGNLQALGQGLSDKVHALEHSLQDRVHALEHRLQDGVHALEGRLSESFTDNLHQLQVRSRAKVDA